MRNSLLKVRVDKRSNPLLLLHHVGYSTSLGYTVLLYGARRSVLGEQNSELNRRFRYIVRNDYALLASS
jgi:hypothetical protein